jgi:hypothetical protein
VTIDAETFRQARAQCVGRGLRLVVSMRCTPRYSRCARTAHFQKGKTVANFFLRDIDAETFRQARAQCVARGLRLVDVINELLKRWNSEQPKRVGPPELKWRQK